ncbi:hypothetical protein J2X31_000190 [Flavobacterium arsenatis]|uniref:DUF4468 domain-containing protein n=1 Tax=Flavobacterium arsenatis TaxID=1484332 RepID=A0ABU1TJN7_9FLAO|nr:hypothetical protein [Flavobacterium arsenatis]MDR6966197.1 hypothetical protein [Flavobacterium arsenatis]
MKKLLPLLCCFYCCLAFSQEKIELTPNGFPTVVIAKPNIPLENLIEASRSWALFYNKNGADVYEVTSNSLKIDALRKGAFAYYSLGERFTFDVKYTLAVEFGDANYTLKLTVKEIYTDDKLIKSTLPDYFTPEGKLKQGFEDIKPSIEITVNKLIASFASYIQR